MPNPKRNGLGRPSPRNLHHVLFVAERREGADETTTLTTSFPTTFDPVGWETKQLAQWEQEGTFERSVQRNKDKGGKAFVFQEGPPTANGKPGLHHVQARTFKDLYCRYKTMQGHVVERKAGWDCHGLPVEREVEKKLGINTLQQVQAFGVTKFNQLCAQSVWDYQSEWEHMTKRMGYWTDLENRYATCDVEYMEAEWWALKQLWNKGLLQKGYKVLPYSPKTGCTYSNRDVAEGYKEVTDLTCFVRFPLVEEVPQQLGNGAKSVSMLAWTSTPWSLPGNVLLAVNKDMTYVLVQVAVEADVENAVGSVSCEAGATYLQQGEVLCVAETLLAELEEKLLKGTTHTLKEVGRLTGLELLGSKYMPPFANAATDSHEQLWRVVHGDFVNSKEGTGVVHVAPMYGEDDHRLCVTQGLDLNLPACQHVVGQDGHFLHTAQVPERLHGLDVTSGSTQEKVLELLQEKGLLFRAEPLTHNYPHCWRNKSHRLLRYAMNSWFVTLGDPAVSLRMQQLNSTKVQFAPDHVREGRFGGWLRESRDWCVSRQRTWGCPLPVWVCRKEQGGCGAEHCVGSRAELQSLLADESATTPLDDLHTNQVDSLVLRCSSCSAVGAMKREPYVLDCWFDSGCAPFAQQYGEGNTGHPVVDFVAEGQDQCRGWFHSLLAVSTTLFDRPAYKKCLVLGLVLDKNGDKMSKSKGNVVNPWHHFNEEGADAVRWYLLGMCAPWADRRFDADKVRSANQKFFCVLFNVSKWWHSQWKAVSHDARGQPEARTSLGALDRWVLSRLARLVKTCNECFGRDAYHVAVSALEQFVGEELSKSYVRLSRANFSNDPRPLVTGLDSPTASSLLQARLSCLQTMRTVLLYVCRLVAPMAPFFVDALHRSLMESMSGTTSPDHSVHLARWPTAEAVTHWVDPLVEEQMGWLVSVMEGGRLLHAKGNRPGRLPLGQAFVSLPKGLAASDGASYAELAVFLAHELNVRKVNVLTEAQFKDCLELAQSTRLSPHVGKLGSKYKGEAKEVRAALEVEFGSCRSAHDVEDKGSLHGSADTLTVAESKRKSKKMLKKQKAKASHQVAPFWEGAKVEMVLEELQRGDPLVLTTSTKSYCLLLEDFHLSRQPKEGFAVSSGAGLVLDLTVTQNLMSAYLAKELTHFVHRARKSLDKKRLQQGSAPLDHVSLRVVLATEEEGYNPLSDQAWNHVVEATRADPTKSLLEQKPNKAMLDKCVGAVEEGLMLEMSVPAYGGYPEVRVLMECNAADAKETAYLASQKRG